MHTKRTGPGRVVGRLLLPGLALTVLLAGAATARAGTLDLALLQQSGDILDSLKQKGYKNVGVLPFRVQRGARGRSFAGGPLGHNITRRLKNALILTLGGDDEGPI